MYGDAQSHQKSRKCTLKQGDTILHQRRCAKIRENSIWGSGHLRSKRGWWEWTGRAFPERIRQTLEWSCEFPVIQQPQGPTEGVSGKKSVAHTSGRRLCGHSKWQTRFINIRGESSKIVHRERKKKKETARFFLLKSQYHFRKLNMPRAYFSRTLKCLNKLLEGGLQGMIFNGLGCVCVNGIGQQLANYGLWARFLHF